jgi:hypothetical protein
VYLPGLCKGKIVNIPLVKICLCAAALVCATGADQVLLRGVMSIESFRQALSRSVKEYMYVLQ